MEEQPLMNSLSEMENDFVDETYKITLVSGDRNVDALIVGKISLESGIYAIIHPLDDPSFEEDEAIVFQVFPSEDGDNYRCIEDEDIVDQVFAEYSRLKGV